MRSSVQVSGRGNEFARGGGEGGQATFTFCPDRDATVLSMMTSLEELIAIPVGAFAEPSFPGPSISVYEHRMHTWVVMPGGIEHAR